MLPKMIGNDGIKAFGESEQHQVQFLRHKSYNILRQIGRRTSQQKQKKIHQKIGPADSKSQSDKDDRVDGVEKTAAGHQQDNHGRHKE